MASHNLQPQRLVLFGILLVLAPIIGYALTTPMSLFSIGVLGLVLLGLLIPVLLRWHHLFLILAWNASISLFFLPGRPELWMLMAGVSFGFSMLDRVMIRKQTFTYIPSIVWPLFMLAAVVALTSKIQGGFGLQVFGGNVVGGRRFIYIVAAILGFFALAGQRIPPDRAKLYVALFFLTSVTAMVSNLAYLGGPKFYFLYYLFPSGFAMSQALADYTIGGSFARLSGFAFAGPAVAYVMLLRYGIKGISALNKPWRLLFFVMAVTFGLLGGFRSVVVMTVLLMTLLFWFEKLYRTRLIVVAVVALVIGGTALVGFAKHLPLPVQRSVSFLPIEVDARAKYDAMSTTEWRLKMWQLLLPEVPRHLFLGKGYSIDPTEMYLLTEAVKHGFYTDTELTILGGSYHSGPLTLIIPLGIWGVIAFLWFAAGAIHYLYRAYKMSPPELKLVNTFLLAYFLMRFIYFVLFYGQFAEDLFVFTGIVGLSVSLNGVGVARATEPVLEPQLATRPALAT